ncbi:MAG: nucleoside deaminase [Bacteroidales bacterium]|jgi:tRNA(adenine34) deaminase|nr:nucleoside deaminase [Bacteroidales bacterium]HPB01341.1 nucleoside deaminase [Bacteroidales bacterium]
MENQDEKFMQEALKEAFKAFANNEVPIGAVLVHNNRIVARAYNQTELLKDVTAHAEILLITAYSADSGMKYLEDFTLYVTLEPCAMCAGALKWARIGRIVYAADDLKFGYTTLCDKILHPKTTVSKGVCQKESVQLLKEFFAKKRL